jgi:GT2 family glycosyltransferase
MTDSELLQLEDLAFVEQAYQALLGRAADPAGLRNYLERVRAGAPKALILAELRASEEAQRKAHRSAKPGTAPPAASTPPLHAYRAPPPSIEQLLRLEDRAFVEQAYRIILGRSADPSGLRNYLQELRSGVGRFDVLHELLQSAEGQRVNAPLPLLRAMLRRRRSQRLPGVRHALQALRLARRRLGLEAGKRARTRNTTLPIPVSIAAEGHDPLRPRSGFRAGSLHHPNTKTMTEKISASATGSRLAAAATDVEQWAVDATKPDAGSPLAAAAPEPCNLHAERLVGPTLHGWSAIGDQAASVAVSFAKRALGRVVPNVPRPELQAAHGLIHDTVGFAAVVGGLLQFAAMAPACSTLHLAQQGEGGTELSIDLQQHLPEALSFSPMRAMLRAPPGIAGNVRSMRLLSPTEAAIVFETDATVVEPAPSVYVDFYQERTAGELVRIARFALELGGQLHDLAFRLPDMQRPLLMVVTDAERAIIATDCFPLPVLFAEANAPLVEYHVTLESGKSAFGVVAKIARSFLDAAIHAREARPQGNSPQRADTCLVLYARGSADLSLESAFAACHGLAAELVFLDAQGRVHTAQGTRGPLAEYLATSRARHFLLHDAEAHLRPDFWAIVDNNSFRLAQAPSVVHWHSLWIDGMARPQVVKAGLLLHPAFAGLQLLEARSLLVSRAALQRAVLEHGEKLASGRLVLEQAFAFIEPSQVVCLPVVMHTVRVPVTPMMAQRFQSEHVVLPRHPAQVLRGSAQVRGGLGVSAIINYRDGVHDTLRCLESLATQDLEGPLEVILVNNGSTPSSVETVLGRARDLFGAEQVSAIDYPHRFNHSTQCNVAAVAARHAMLLMLSNDSVLVTPSAVARSAAVAQVPWVGTCGFRIIGNEAHKRRLQSLGLTLNQRRYLFAGGSPVATNLAPAFALDCAFEVVGNTFAAVMLRREVYFALDGLDADAFPTNYNDVDFSFRALNAGYRHVVLGSEIVEHVGRGSREADQDLPIDQRIVERAPRLDLLARVGFQQL